MAEITIAGVIQGIQLAAAAYSIYSLATAPDGPNVQQAGPRLSDLRATISRTGTAIPLIRGSGRLGGNVIDMSDIRETAITSTQSGGGKGPDPGSVTTTNYIYDADVCVAICEGPILGIRRIWADGRLIYTRAETAGIGSAAYAASLAADVRVYLGTETQQPDPTFEALRGAGNVPAYRGIAYIAFERLALGQFGNRVPSFTFEVLTHSAPTVALPITTLLNGTDANYPGSWSGAANYNNAGTALWCGAYGITSWDLNSGVQIAQRSFLASTSFGALGSVQNMEFSGVGVDASGAFWTLNRGTVNGLNRLMLNKWDASLNSIWTVVTFEGDPGSTPAQAQTVATVVGDAYVMYGYQSKAWRVATNTSNNGDTAAAVELAPWSACMQKFGDAVAWLDTSGGTELRLYRYDGNGLVSAQLASGSIGFHPHIAVDADLFLYIGWNVGGATRIHKIDSSSLALVDSVDLAPNHADVHEFHVLNDGNLLVKQSTTWRRINFDTGATIETSAATEGSSAIANFSGLLRGGTVFWGYETGSVRKLFAVESLARLALPATDGAKLKVGTLVDELLQRCGVPAGHWDIAAIAAVPMDGIALSRVAPGRQVIEMLRAAYPFDLVESEGVLKTLARGGASVVTIPHGDLLVQGDQTVEPLEVERGQELELPAEITVNYLNLSNDYQDGTETAQRPIGDARAHLVIDLPLVLTPTKAAQVANVLIDQALIGRNKITVPTTRKYAKYEPGDVVTVGTREGGSLRVHLLERREVGNRILFAGELDDAIVFNPNAVGGSSTLSTTDVSVAGPTKVELLDIPLILDAHDGEELYVAMAGYSGSWPGAAVYRSPDNGTYSQVGAVTVPAVMGVTTTALANWPGGNVVDTANTVTVQLQPGGTLSSTDFAGLMAGTNVAVIGNEIVYFKDAELVSAGIYTLRNLQRGRRGTEANMASHASGERFVLMSTAGIVRPAMDSTDIGVARYYRVPTLGQSYSNAATISHTNTAAGLKPYSPQFVKGTRHTPDTNDWRITWFRRTRLGGHWHGVPAPLSEASEAYDIEILNVSNVVVRTLTAATTQVDYTAAQQVTDFGVAQTSIKVRIYQRSAIVGRGFGTAIITV